MNIVYFGTDVFIDSFIYLADNYNISALYTYHNDEDYFTEYTIVKEAKKRSIPVSYGKITDDDIRRYAADGDGLFLFVAEYCHIIDIPEDVPGVRGVNVHSSLLPEGRGYYPIECAFAKNKAFTGVTMHELTMNLDSGDILFQKKFEITDNVDSIDIYLSAGRACLEMTKKLMSDTDNVFANRKAQTEHLPYWKRPADELLEIDHGMTCAEARDIFRRFNSMTEIELAGEKYFVRALMCGSALIVKDEIRISDDTYIYRVSDGNLRITIMKLKEALI